MTGLDTNVLVRYVIQDDVGALRSPLDDLVEGVLEMLEKILIASRGDNGRKAVAVQAHAGAAGVMPEPNCLASEASGDRAAGAGRV